MAPQATGPRTILVLLLLIWITVPAVGSDDSICPGKSEVLEDMASQFTLLRTIKGHFSGGAWNGDVDQWMGPKHKLMRELGSTLGGGLHGRPCIVQLMGSPDQIIHSGNPLFDQIGHLPQYDGIDISTYQFLVYYWRGSHDFLFFAVRGDKIMGSGWWHAGD